MLNWELKIENLINNRLIYRKFSYCKVCRHSCFQKLKVQDKYILQIIKKIYFKMNKIKMKMMKMKLKIKFIKIKMKI